MSKEESTLIKGIAILLMLFLHLFNKENLADICQPTVYIGNTPLVHIMSRAANPVALFVILSGYGLSTVYARGNLDFKSQVKRLFKLYIHYWLVLLIFVTIGHFIYPDRYPGSLTKVFLNATSWSNSYNAEHWFLFPYAMVSLTAYPIFRLMDKLGNKKSLLLFLFLTLASGYIVSRYIAVYKLYDSLLSRALTYVGFLFSFSIGAVMYRVNVQRGLRIGWFERHTYSVMLLLLILISFRCLFKTGAFHSIYVFIFIILFLHIPLHRIIREFLLRMGEYSMVMWLTHSFFCYYLFKDYIYGCRFPVVIYCVLLLVSNLSAIPIKYVAGIIIKRIMNQHI